MWSIYEETNVLQELTVQIASVFIGALLAFILTFLLYLIQRMRQNIEYLQYAIADICSISSYLYSFKFNAIGRFQEAEEVEKAIGSSPSSIHTNEIGRYIHGAKFNSSISLERVSFLVNQDPNIIALLSAMIRSANTLSSMVSSMNDEISVCRNKDEQLKIKDVHFICLQNKMLSGQLDETMYLVEKSMEVLTLYGKCVFGKSMRIKDIKLLDEKYEALRPPVMDSWERGWHIKPKRLRWIKKFF